MFTDSHCHLNFPELADNIHSIRADMATAQVTRALVISTSLERFPEAVSYTHLTLPTNREV